MGRITEDGLIKTTYAGDNGPSGDRTGGYRSVSEAHFSEDGVYRYLLRRVWDEGAPRALFVLLNPSTADAIKNDNTVKRCIERAGHWSLGGVTILNLFAVRSTDPRHVRAALDPVGPRNDEYIRREANDPRHVKVVLGWGPQGGYRDRDRAVLAMIAHLHPAALGLTKAGYPGHPLYLGYDRMPVPYRLDGPRSPA